MVGIYILTDIKLLSRVKACPDAKHRSLLIYINYNSALSRPVNDPEGSRGGVVRGQDPIFPP